MFCKSAPGFVDHVAGATREDQAEGGLDRPGKAGLWRWCI